MSKMPGTDKRQQDEGGVKKQIKAILNRYEWFWWMPPMNGYGQSGVSDFNAVKTGMFLAVEAKSGKNKPTPQQIGFLNSIRAQDGFAFVVNEGNLTFLDQFLAALDRSVAARVEGRDPTDEDGSLMLNAIKALTELIPANG